MKLHIKAFSELTVPELYAILRIRSAVFVVEQNCVYQDPDGIDQKSFHVYLEEDGKVLAYLRMFPSADDETTVQIGRVLTGVRGKGYGRQVLEYGITAARNRMQAKRIYLEAQCYATGFYEKAGFRVISEAFEEDGIPHVQMTKDLL